MAADLSRQPFACREAGEMAHGTFHSTGASHTYSETKDKKGSRCGGTEWSKARPARRKIAWSGAGILPGLCLRISDPACIAVFPTLEHKEAGRPRAVIAEMSRLLIRAKKIVTPCQKKCCLRNRATGVRDCCGLGKETAKKKTADHGVSDFG